MDKRYIVLLIIVVVFISGCMPNIKFSKELEEEDNAYEEVNNMDNYCIDNNGNGVCDKNEVPAKVTPVEEKIPEVFTEMIQNQERIESYSYVKKTYEDGLESKVIQDKYEVFYKDGNMKQLIGNNVYYINDGVAYDYYWYDNESYVVSDSNVKENTLMEELEGAENLIVEKEDTKYGSYNVMIVNYDKSGDFYRVTIWKYYAVPLLVEINNQDDEGDIVRYEPLMNKVDDEDVILPDSVIIE